MNQLHIILYYYSNGQISHPLGSSLFTYIPNFKYDIYQFRNVIKKDPVMKSGKDINMCRYIRQVSLDSFWSKAGCTVGGNWGKSTYTSDMQIFS